MTETNQFSIDLEDIGSKKIFSTTSEIENYQKTIDKMVETQLKINEVKALGISKTNDILAFQIQNHKMFGGVAIKNRLLKQLDYIGNIELQLVHGDFQPANIYKKSGRQYVVDWTNASAGSPLTDAAKTYMLFKLSNNRYANYFLKTYAQKAEVNKADILAWTPIIAASMLVDGRSTKKEQKILFSEIDDFVSKKKRWNATLFILQLKSM